MFRLLVGLLSLTSIVSGRPPPQDSQHVLDVFDASSEIQTTRKLRGKFLHITDIHPDPFYRTGSDPDGEHPCHGGNGRAGYYGAEATSCDSPISLINATFDWIKENIRDEVDFVIWTGDSARHDNDELYPRTNKQVEQLNQFVVTKFDEVFGRPDNKHDHDPTNDFVVPIIPTYGNNDILPHNILEPGPNRWTRKYLTIWEKFIPQEQRHSFARGGWFFTEVIPKKLAVFSLNTLYFFESNGAVDGCYDPNEPGYEHFEWLRIQLQFLRERGMKAILTGHVPPARTESKQNWDESCYQKYNLWLRQYRDVVVGNVYGHMNIDHFVLHDVKELNYKFKIPGIDDKLRSRALHTRDHPHINAKNDYLTDLRDHWKNLPRPPRSMAHLADDAEVTSQTKNKKHESYEQYLKEIGGPYGERFSLSVISPSIVPNFFPSLRIVEYNISGLENDHPASSPTAPGYHDVYQVSGAELEEQPSSFWWDVDDLENDSDSEADKLAQSKKKKKKKKKPKKSKPNFRLPSPPSKTAAPGPAYSPQTFSWTSWQQLYANLTEINRAAAKDYNESVRGNDNTSAESIFKKHFDFELEYDTRDDRVYKLKDLTVRSWLNLAEKIARTDYRSPEEKDDNTLHDMSTEAEADLASLERVDEQSSDNFDTENKKHKKGKKRKGKSLKKNRLWHTFLRRAFVGTKSDDQLEQEFG